MWYPSVVEVFDGHRALLRPLVAPAVALGNFDGVHAGHQQLLTRAVALASSRGGDAVAYTFEPHPAAVLAPDLAPPRITSRRRKLELIAALDIDVCIVEPFTRDLASQTPDAFLTAAIAGSIGARDVIVGYDFTYGAKRAGTTTSLCDFGDRCGFQTHIISPVLVRNIIASSSTLRDFAQHGKLADMTSLLGRLFDVDGVVVKGAGRGRTIGIPTANVAVPAEQLMPMSGVYAVTVQLLDDAETLQRPGIANLGTNPTFVTDGHLSLEVHLFDFEREIYQAPIRVTFREHIRAEQRFDDPGQLIDQIHRDIASARQALGAGEHHDDKQ